MMKVFVTDKSWPNYASFSEQVNAAGGTAVFASAKDEDTLIREGSDADIVVNSFAKCTPKFINSLTNCQMIIRTGISVDTIDVPTATAKGIKVCYVNDYCRDEVADHTFTLAIASIRKAMLLDRRMHEGVWNSVEAGYVPRLNTLTFGLIGFGAIARKLAVRVQAFGMAVIAYDPYLAEKDFAACGVKNAATLDELYAQADVISLHLPLLPSTYHCIDAKAFAKMKDGVFFVNTARGGLVDTEALIDSLKSGKVCAAGLDVFETEPLGLGSELVKLPNVILTPHAAYYSNDSLPELQQKSTDEVLRTLRGEPNKVIFNRSDLLANGVAV